MGRTELTEKVASVKEALFEAEKALNNLDVNSNYETDAKIIIETCMMELEEFLDTFSPLPEDDYSEDDDWNDIDNE
jgi:hypothetical protein